MIECVRQFSEIQMAHIRGIGGVFFKSKDPKKLKEWYIEKLDLKPDKAGYIYFRWENLDTPGYTLWSPFPEGTKYFEPSKAEFMINFVVSDIDQFVEVLRGKGVDVDNRGVEDTEQGRFAWCMDPEGNRIELWEPKND